MASVTQLDSPVQVTTVCTSVGGGNSTLTPKNPDIGFATTIVINGNASYIVGRDYLVTVEKIN